MVAHNGTGGVGARVAVGVRFGHLKGKKQIMQKKACAGDRTYQTIKVFTSTSLWKSAIDYHMVEWWVKNGEFIVSMLSTGITSIKGMSFY